MLPKYFHTNSATLVGGQSDMDSAGKQYDQSLDSLWPLVTCLSAWGRVRNKAVWGLGDFLTLKKVVLVAFS